MDDRKICLKYPNIAIHAVSRDSSVFPFKPCVLLVYSTPAEDDLDEEVTINYRLSTEEPEQCVLVGLACTLHNSSFGMLLSNSEYHI